MATITVRCIANSYHNNTLGLSLSKGQEIEIEESSIQDAIKTKYLIKIGATTQEETKVAEPTETEEKPKIPTKKSK